MNIIVFGSTGRIGEVVILRALERGHHVTAFARQPEQLAIQHPNLALARGDVLDGASLRAALAGQQAAISVLAVRRGSGLLLAEGLANLVQALSETGVHRFIYLVPPKNGILPPSKAALAEQAVIYRCISSSCLEWTVAQGAALSPARLAAALLDELEQPHHICEAMPIG